MSLLSQIRNLIKNILPNATDEPPVSPFPKAPETDITQQPTITPTQSSVEQPKTVFKRLSLGTRDLIDRLQKQVKQVFQSRADRQYKKQIEEAIQTRKNYYSNSGRVMGDTLNTPYKSQIILQELERRIATWESDSNAEGDTARGQRCSRLQSLLNEQISQYGRSAVAYSCEQAGHTVITNAGVYVFASSQEEREQGWLMFEMLITGEVLTPDEAKELGNAMDNSDTINPFEE